MENDKNTLDKLVVGLMIAVLFVNGFNMYQMQGMKSQISTSQPNGMLEMSYMSANQIPETNSGIEVIPKGIPKIYGAELGVSYDDISASDQQKSDATIRKIGMLDQQISLSGKDKERYIAIAGQISCEYCCGVESIIFKDGSAACGCAHSFAMRGIAKYLIKNHGSEFTDNEILEELGKWKTLFFPSQMSKKAAVLKDKGIEIDYINLASNKYRGIEN